MEIVHIGGIGGYKDREFYLDNILMIERGIAIREKMLKNSTHVS